MPARGHLVAQVPYVVWPGARSVTRSRTAVSSSSATTASGSMQSGCFHPTNHRRCSKMLVDVVHEIGARMGAG
jgi:hypothetical protein